MINSRTVLILGAGSNAGYGFPSGTQLITEIYNSLENHTIKGFLLQLGIAEFEISSFRDRLLHSGLDSIDEFLEKNPKYSSIGKASIALMLMQCERPDEINLKVTNSQDRWYLHLHKKLVEGVTSPEQLALKNQGLTIITYNYDRSLEYYLAFKLSKTFSEFENATSAKKSLKFLQFIHIHGDIGEYLTEGNLYREYGGRTSLQDLQTCVNRIRIVHEDCDYENIHMTIKKAEKVLFLGFGFGDKNLERLFADRDTWNGKFIYGTTLGLTENKLRRLKDKFKTSGFGPFNDDPNLMCSAILNRYLE